MIYMFLFQWLLEIYKKYLLYNQCVTALILKVHCVKNDDICLIIIQVISVPSNAGQCQWVAVNVNSGNGNNDVTIIGILFYNNLTLKIYKSRGIVVDVDDVDVDVLRGFLRWHALIVRRDGDIVVSHTSSCRVPVRSFDDGHETAVGVDCENVRQRRSGVYKK